MQPEAAMTFLPKHWHLGLAVALTGLMTAPVAMADSADNTVHAALSIEIANLDNYYDTVYTNKNVANSVGTASPYAKYGKKYGTLARRTGSADRLTTLCSRYGKSVTVEAVKKELHKVKEDLYKTYPLLPLIGSRRSDTPAEKVIADYIKMVDKS
jgi:hypothetical protein